MLLLLTLVAFVKLLLIEDRVDYFLDSKIY